MTRRVIKSVALMIVVVALALVPGVSSADLIGSADVVLTLPDPNVQISDTVTVGSGPELIGAAASADWFLELTVTGFVLSAPCPELRVPFRFPGLRLSLSSLDFAPPAVLVGVTAWRRLVDSAASASRS